MRVHLATEDGLFRIDGGTATKVLDGYVEAITPSADGERVLAVVDHHELVEVDGTKAATLASTGDDAQCVIATRDEVFVGTVGAHLLHLLEGALARMETFETLPGRDTWTQPWGAPGDLRSFATDGDQLVLANVHVGGILRTTDGGESWMQTIDPETDVHQVARRDEHNVYAATGAGGLAVSSDGASTWTYVTNGLHGTYLRAVAVVPDGVIASASNGPFTHDGAVYRLATGADTFERCGNGLPAKFDGNVDSHWIASAGSTVVCASPDGTVYASGDGGHTWDELAAGLPAPRAVLVG